MSAFISGLFAEMGARRRRLRASLGDRGQAIAEFLVLSGLAIGSLGLFVRPWMPAAAPWGFAVPGVFLVGYLLIEARRQVAVRIYKQRVTATQDELDQQELDAILEKARAQLDFAPEDLTDVRASFEAATDYRRQARLDQAEGAVAASGYDWLALLFSFGCALLGAAAFVIAWSAEPAPPPEIQDWAPPESAVPVDISP